MCPVRRQNVAQPTGHMKKAPRLHAAHVFSHFVRTVRTGPGSLQHLLPVFIDDSIRPTAHQLPYPRASGCLNMDAASVQVSSQIGELRLRPEVPAKNHQVGGRAGWV